METCLNSLNKLSDKQVYLFCFFFLQATVPLSHLINAFHSPKSSTAASRASVQPVQRDTSPEHDPLKSEVLKTLGKSGGLLLTALNPTNISLSEFNI